MTKQHWLGFTLAIGVFIIIIALLFAPAILSQTPLQSCTLFFSNGVVLHNVPLAITPQQRSRGLSQRDSVGVGMLFHFSQPEHLSFWMHDTRVPLSIGFFSAAGELLQIEDMQPQSDDTHISQQEATDALELPQGGFAKSGLTIGVRLIHRMCE